jgi:hypothetical protein
MHAFGGDAALELVETRAIVGQAFRGARRPALLIPDVISSYVALARRLFRLAMQRYSVDWLRQVAESQVF